MRKRRVIPIGMALFFTFGPLMAIPKINLTDTQLIDGLKNADTQALQQIFLEIQPLAIQTIRKSGGTAANGATFFQMAAVDAAHWLRNQEDISPEFSLSGFLVQRSQEHFDAYRSEATPPPPDSPPTPAREDLRNTRQHAFVWKKISALSTGCAQDVFQIPDASPFSTCLQELRNALKITDEQEELPDYAKGALQRPLDYKIWTELRKYEDNAEKGLAPDGTDTNKANEVAKYIFIALLVGTLGYMAYSWWNRPKPTAEIFEDNFSAPESLLTDINRRFENDTSGIFRPEACNFLLEKCDEYYKKGQFDEAAETLFAGLDDESMSDCSSDFNFALGLISLKREEPADAIDFFARINNVEAYGEDIYWYQALAFVQGAKHNPGLRAVARRAVERARQNTRDEARNKAAEQMLKELAP